MTRLNDRPIASGQVGEHTQRLLSAYAARPISRGRLVRTMSESSAYSVRILRGIDEVSEADWNRLLSLDPRDECDPGGDPPFCDHRFLSALEGSGCAAAERGFVPCHFCSFRARAHRRSAGLYQG